MKNSEGAQISTEEDENMTVLTEKHYIIYASGIPHSCEKYREEGCSIVYEDEMYILICLTGHKNWCDHCA
jgi:hypothetical protein